MFGDEMFGDEMFGDEANDGTDSEQWKLPSTTAFHLPQRNLRQYVLGYFDLDSVQTRTVRRRLLPHLLVTVLIDFIPPRRRIESVDGVVEPSIRLPVNGPRDRPQIFEQSGRHRAVCVDLTPLGAYALFGIPMRELANASVDFTDLLGNEGRFFVERLADAGTGADRARVVDAMISARMARSEPSVGLVDHAWRQVNRTAGAIRIGALADRLGVSRRHLEKQFDERIGLSPKAAARVVRFQRALALAESDKPWSEIASICGYTDQSHLSREVRDLSGLTPGRLRGRAIAAGGRFLVEGDAPG
ncbi:helix-turn-helix domain-containing protein [Nocardia sp. NPDC052566]|uniref:helix-turn-helix domain-containing protein n=1 Tax=Nocardia sp. NPDC052566 TaxID=3364330 RepID=UPI0037C589F3